MSLTPEPEDSEHTPTLDEILQRLHDLAPPGETAAAPPAPRPEAPRRHREPSPTRALHAVPELEELGAPEPPANRRYGRDLDSSQARHPTAQRRPEPPSPMPVERDLLAQPVDVKPETPVEAAEPASGPSREYRPATRNPFRTLVIWSLLLGVTLLVATFILLLG